MPLAEFIAEVMQIIDVGPPHGEICVKRVMPLRNSEASGNFGEVSGHLNTVPQE